MKIKNNKRAQQEMVGFVIIVVIVTIIGVIFLSLTAFKVDKTRKSSIEVSNFLQAAMYYTTDCASDYYPRYREMQDLIKDCNKNSEKKCKDGRKVCDALESFMKKALDESLKPSEDYHYKAYKLEIYFKALNSKEAPNSLVSTQNGIFSNCSSIQGGSQTVSPGSLNTGLINVELEICNG
jgi:hypothetical protein